jgi:hypothetical protein
MLQRKQALMRDIAVVTPDWIVACCSAQLLVPIAAYSVLKPASVCVCVSECQSRTARPIGMPSVLIG